MSSSFEVNDKALVSIIIPSKDNLKLLKNCIESIKNKTSYKNYEIILVDNGSRKKETKEFLGSLNHKIIVYDHPFNFSHLNNIAVTHAKGKHIIFLNDDTKVISADWIEQMLVHSEKPEVGAVGALLLYPDDTIQHAGVLVGVGGLTSHAFEGLPSNYKVNEDQFQRIRECSAVTAACMMIKKSLFEQLGGFDENLAYSYNDVDLCLRLQEKGYKTIFTPFAILYHHGTSSRPYSQDDNEMRYFVKRWRDTILRGDPYYDKTLSRVSPYEPKKPDEDLVLSDTRLYDKSEQRLNKRFSKYVEASNKVRKKHGTRRLLVEIMRFFKK